MLQHRFFVVVRLAQEGHDSGFGFWGHIHSLDSYEQLGVRGRVRAKSAGVFFGGDNVMPLCEQFGYNVFDSRVVVPQGDGLLYLQPRAFHVAEKSFRVADACYESGGGSGCIAPGIADVLYAKADIGGGACAIQSECDVLVVLGEAPCPARGEQVRDALRFVSPFKAYRLRELQAGIFEAVVAEDDIEIWVQLVCGRVAVPRGKYGAAGEFVLEQFGFVFCRCMAEDGDFFPLVAKFVCEPDAEGRLARTAVTVCPDNHDLRMRGWPAGPKAQPVVYNVSGAVQRC